VKGIRASQDVGDPDRPDGLLGQRQAQTQR